MRYFLSIFVVFFKQIKIGGFVEKQRNFSRSHFSLIEILVLVRVAVSHLKKTQNFLSNLFFQARSACMRHRRGTRDKKWPSALIGIGRLNATKSARVERCSDIGSDIAIFLCGVVRGRYSQQISEICRRQLPGQSLTEQ